VKNVKDLERELRKARQLGKPVLFDFYADWCVSCKVLELHLFGNATVQRALTKFVLLRADVTANNPASKALENKYQVIGPPTMIFFNGQGKELTHKKIVGEVDNQRFLQLISDIG